MKLLSFKIKNFRSIIDTGWTNLSLDNVTALVGQNESGKTAILEALSKTFSSEQVERDDYRHGEPPPEIGLITGHSAKEILVAAESISNEICKHQIIKKFATDGLRIEWHFHTEKNIVDPEKSSTFYSVVNPNLRSILNECYFGGDSTTVSETPTSSGSSAAALAQQGIASPAQVDKKAVIEETVTQFSDALFEMAPTIVLFKESSGLLPNIVDISDDFKLVPGVGTVAAKNFLTIARIDLKDLVESDTRSRAAILKKANREVTERFLAFWSQTIGKVSALQLECAINHYPIGHEKAGRGYLEFLITDSSAPLYPKQRSRGTRWFISFFLQLQASKIKKTNQFFLLDEPGANLHEKAQANVLDLIESIRDSTGIIYSTHSPHLIRDLSFQRILAVERDPDQETHPTRVIGAHALGAASTDTLSPILTAMGVSLSRQTAIKQKNNVILEELSSYYYLKSFWKLTNCQQECHLLPATGTSNVPLFAQLFLGWGLDFVVVVDDEPSGRAVYNSLKRDCFLDDADWASKRMYKIPKCEGIEDIFEVGDYKNLILEDPTTLINGANSKWAKTHGAAKAIHALKFLHKIESGSISLGVLHQDTQANITLVVDQIAIRLREYQ